MKIEDTEEVQESYSYGILPFDVPFVKLNASKGDEAVEGFFVKKPNGLLSYYPDLEWPNVLDHDFFNDMTLFRICTPKRVISEWPKKS